MINQYSIHFVFIENEFLSTFFFYFKVVFAVVVVVVVVVVAVAVAVAVDEILIFSWMVLTSLTSRTIKL